MAGRHDTVVVKIGTSSITDDEGVIDRASVGRLCDGVAALRTSGRRVGVVTSGAIAAGLPELGLGGSRRPKDAVTLQASTLPTWLTFDPLTGVLEGPPLKDHVGDHAITIDATDTNGAQTAQSFVLTITPNDNLVPGDANQDGVVDIADLGIVGANFNKTSVEWSQGAFNGDMKVDIADLGIIGANWTAADSAVALYAASNPRSASLHAKEEATRSNRLDLAALLEQDDQTELARILGGHSIL